MKEAVEIGRWGVAAMSVEQQSSVWIQIYEKLSFLPVQ